MVAASLLLCFVSCSEYCQSLVNEYSHQPTAKYYFTIKPRSLARYSKPAVLDRKCSALATAENSTRSRVKQLAIACEPDITHLCMPMRR